MISLRAAEAASILHYVQWACDQGYLSGRVLDYGCGQQPYRLTIEAHGAEYVGYDRAAFPANISGEDVGATKAPIQGPWNSILCTQVIQYLPLYRYGTDPQDPDEPNLQSVLTAMRYALETGGHLVLTYPTNWPEVEPEDLHRFTKAGMERLLTEAGFTIIRHEKRHQFTATSGEVFAAGYGAVAQA